MEAKPSKEAWSDGHQAHDDGGSEFQLKINEEILVFDDEIGIITGPDSESEDFCPKPIGLALQHQVSTAEGGKGTREGTTDPKALTLLEDMTLSDVDTGGEGIETNCSESDLDSVSGVADTKMAANCHVLEEKQSEPSLETQVTWDHSPNSPSDECYIHDLPDEIMNLILHYLTLGELCRTVAHVCRRWCGLVTDPIHWQSLAIGHLTPSALIFCLERAPLLKYLNLDSRDSLTVDEVYRFAKHCPLLKELELAFCDNLNNEQIRVLAVHCDNLRRLNMEGCRLVDDESLKLVSRMKRLTSLNVSHCTLIQTEGVEALALNLSCLKELNIDGIPNVSDNAIFTLVLHHGHRLEYLDLDGVNLTDSAVQAISKCECLTHLHISFAELLTDTALLCVKKMKTLRSLRLRKGAYFSREGLIDMFTNGFLADLTSLCLSECVQLYDDGVQALVKCCGKNLRQLDIQWCWFITDVGLEMILKNCKEMEKLNLLGLDKIHGQCLDQIPKVMKKLVELDLQQCNRIIDDIVVDLVREMPHLVAYNYYGERFQYNSDGVLVIQ